MITKEALHQEKLMRCFEKTGAVLFFGKKTKTYKKESKIEKIRDNLKIYHNLQV